MPDYYRLDVRRLPLRELWHIAPSLFSFIIAIVIHKVLRIPLPDQPALRRPDALIRFQEADVPPPLRSGFDAVIGEFEGLGFSKQFFYRCPTLGRFQTHAVALRSPDGLLLGIAIAAGPATSPPDAWVRAVSSRLENGHILSTTTLPPLLDVPPEHKVTRLVGRPLADLVAHQRAWLERHQGQVRSVLPSELEQHLTSLEQREFDFQVARGAFTLVPVAEVDKLRALWDDELGEGRESSTSIQPQDGN